MISNQLEVLQKHLDLMFESTVMRGIRKNTFFFVIIPVTWQILLQSALLPARRHELLRDSLIPAVNVKR